MGVKRSALTNDEQDNSRLQVLSIRQQCPAARGLWVRQINLNFFDCFFEGMSRTRIDRLRAMAEPRALGREYGHPLKSILTPTQPLLVERWGGMGCKWAT